MFWVYLTDREARRTLRNHKKYAMNTELNPYACLGLMPGSTTAEIKRRYRTLAKQYHPDCNPPAAGDGQKLRDLNAAYALLSDPARKAVYDSRHSPFNPARVPQPAPAVRPMTVPGYHLSRRRADSLCATAGLTMLLLVSAGVGVVCSAANSAPSTGGLFSRLAGTAQSDPASRPYSFLPAHGTFDDPSSPLGWQRTPSP